MSFALFSSKQEITSECCMVNLQNAELINPIFYVCIDTFAFLFGSTSGSRDPMVYSYL